MTPETVQAFLRGRAVQGRVAHRLDPFVLFLDPHRPDAHLNYAIPSDRAAPDPTGIERLKEAFRARQRLLRLEWVAERAPRVGPALCRAGLRHERWAPLMGCAVDQIRARAVAGARLEAGTGSCWREVVNLQRAAFGHLVLPADQDPDPQQPGGGLVTAWVGGEMVAVAEHSPVLDGLSEIVGVATVAEWRGRGLGAWVTAAAARAATAAGARTVVLSAMDEGAERVYRRAGFERVATLVHMSAPP